METHTIDTKFGPVQVRVYRLREGWWPVIIGRHRAPTAPSLEEPLPQSVEQGITRMQEAVDGLTS